MGWVLFSATTPTTIMSAFFLLLALYQFTLVFCDEEIILVITKNGNESVNSNYSLTTYIERGKGFPRGQTRCEPEPGSVDREVADDSNGECLGDTDELLDLCQAAFDDYNQTYCLTTQTAAAGNNDSIYLYNRTKLCDQLNSIRREYLNFRSILDRTLVGVYAKTCENKSMCLVSCVYI